MSRNGDVSTIAAIFTVAGGFALVGGLIVAIYVARLSSVDVHEMLAEMGENGSSRGLLVTRLGGWQYMAVGLGALIAAAGLWKMQSWGRNLALSVVGGYCLWEALNVWWWWSDADRAPGRGFETGLALVISACAALVARWLHSLRDEFGPAQVTAGPVESRFFPQLHCDVCRRPRKTGWKFCPYCHTPMVRAESLTAMATSTVSKDLDAARGALVQKLGGDRDVAARLVDLERRRNPKLDELALVRAAEFRLLHDRRS